MLLFIDPLWYFIRYSCVPTRASKSDTVDSADASSACGPNKSIEPVHLLFSRRVSLTRSRQWVRFPAQAEDSLAWDKATVD